MTLTRAYLLLCGFYTLLLLIGLAALLGGGGSLLAVLQLGVGGLAVMGLWGYFLETGIMNPRMWRSLAGLLAIGLVVQLGAVFLAGLSGAALSWALSGAIFSVLPMILLYRYGDRDQPLWASPEEREGGRVLGALLDVQPDLRVDKHTQDSPASVRIRRHDDTYLARVQRRHDGDIEAFEARFRCPATLAFFIEKFTCIAVSDFADKYGGHDTRAA